MDETPMEAMREALGELMEFTCNSCERRFCEEYVEEDDGRGIPSPCSAIIKARNALAAPRRNCEVGTPSEQYQRFLKYCKKNTGGCNRADRYSNPCAYCFSQWAQMPYEEKEGGAK